MSEPDYKDAARRLWMLLDDIDTLDDACRADDAAFRKHARDAQRKRFAILSGEQFDALATPPALQQQEEPREVAGWKLVPVEATAAMQRAADDYSTATASKPKGMWWWGRIYEAMLAASPSPQDFTLPMVEEGKHCDTCETQTICADFPAQRPCGVKEVPRG